MKLLYHHIALVFLLAAACEDPLEDKVFTPEDAHVRFEFQDPDERADDPTNLPLDTFRISYMQADTLRIPVVLASAPLAETVEIQFSAQTSENIALGQDVFLYEDNFAETDFRLQISPGSFATQLLLVYAGTLNETADVSLELTAVSPDFLSLGFPGPDAKRKTFTIVLEEP